MPDETSPAVAKRRRPELSTVVLAVISLLYPFIAMIAVRTVGPAPVVIALCVLLVLRVVFGLGKGVPVEVTGAMLLVAGAVGVTALVDRELSVRLYPVFMGLAMLAAFASTLVRPPSMIERLARLGEPDLPPSGVVYTRKVTWVWCAFLLINSLIALWTALEADWKTWTLYNGLISYIAMGVLFAGEWLVRGRVRRRMEGSGRQ